MKSELLSSFISWALNALPLEVVVRVKYAQTPSTVLDIEEAE